MKYLCLFCQQRGYSEKIRDGVLFKENVVGQCLNFFSLKADLPWTKYYFWEFYLQLLNTKNNEEKKKKKKRKTKDQVKKELACLLIENDSVDNKILNEKESSIKKLEDAILNVKEYETIIKIKKKGILNIAYRQGSLFQQFKEPDKFVEKFNESGVSKSKVYFKIKVVKILEKYPRLKSSSLSLNVFKSYLKVKKEVRKENKSEFKQLLGVNIILRFENVCFFR